jgi:hypothetical protein
MLVVFCCIPDIQYTSIKVKILKYAEIAGSGDRYQQIGKELSQKVFGGV